MTNLTLAKAAIGIASAVALLGAAAPAFADETAYDTNPGRMQAIAVGAQCGSGAGSGAFGFFGGKDNNLSGGADGTQTGINNSSVCGNR